MTSIVFDERAGAVSPVNGLNPGAATAPTLADLDGDGDLDLVVGEQGGRVRYYLNTGAAWAPRFSQQSGNNNPFGRIDLVGDATTTPALADMDADGDLDLVMGDAGGDLNYYENIGAAVAPTFAKRSGTSNPFNGLDVNGGAGLGYSAPAVADLDGDGDLDLAVGAKDGSIRYYENSGSATVMAFSGNPATGASGAANPFAGISVSGDAAPAFWDMDGDGDLDLVVGQNQNPGVDRHHGGFRYFENTGNALAPAFTERTIAANPFDGFSGNNFDDAFTKPTLADLDGDGAPDLVFGNRGNGLEYREGVRDVETSRPSIPLIYREAAADPFSGIAAGQQTAPAFWDLDRDGDLDLVLGDLGGGLRYYRNTGNARAPRYEEQVGAAANPFHGIDVDIQSLPAFGDLDRDGDPDLVIGSVDGRLYYYRNTGNAGAPRYEAQSGVGNPFNGIDAGTRSKPALADLDGDGDLDLVVLNGGFGTRYYENTGTAAAPAFQRRHGSANPMNIPLDRIEGLTFADLDRDGDLDLVTGLAQEEQTPEGSSRVTGILNHYENTGSVTAPAFATRSGPDNPFRDIEREEFNFAPVFADIDGDGWLELVIGHHRGGLAYYRPVAVRKVHTRNDAGRVVRTDIDDDNDGVIDRAVLDPDGDGNLDRFESYLHDENAMRVGKVGVDLPLSYARAAVNPFAGIDVDREATPALGDLDGDGDLDLVLGEWRSVEFRYYRNNDGAFAEQTGTDNPFAGIDLVTHTAMPRLADLDADGDLDLVVGGSGGILDYYQNTGSATAPAFELQEGDDSPLNFAADWPSVRWDIGPAFADLDADGDLDLLVSNYHIDANRFLYYENTGSAKAPVFTRRDGAANPMDGVEDGILDGAPTFWDLDADGDLDLLVGRRSGWTNYYENVGSAATPVFQRRLGHEERPFHAVVDGNAVPAFADLDGDRFPELVVGNRDGVLKYYQVARSLEAYTLDENGDVIRTDFDDEADGATNRIEHYARVAGQVTATRFDTDADGVIDRREFDANADGTPERTEFDTDDDGDIDRTEFDPDEDGSADRAETYARNDAGFVIRTDFDDDADGATDRITTYARNAAGRATATVIDEDADGTTDRTEYDADADGGIDRIEFNTDDAGSAEYAESYTRNEAGDITRTDFDYGLDGVVNKTHLDTDGDGSMDRAEVHTWDVDNRSASMVAFALPPVYQAVSNSPLAAVALAGNASPTFVDLDGDGDLDLAAGSTAGAVRYWRNNAGAFEEQAGEANPFHFGGALSLADARPAFADLDGDGDLDLVAGERSGDLNYYKNTGSAAAPVFEEQTGDDSPVAGIDDISFYSMPTLADLDGDGDHDLVLGGGGIRLRYYENTGSAAAPVFERRTGAANPVRNIGSDWPVPVFADLDGDGDADLVVGTLQRQLGYYENTGSATAPVFESRDWARTPPAEAHSHRNRFSPTFADLDGDNLLEIFLGDRGGQIRHYRLPVIARAGHALNRNGDITRTDFDDDADGTTDRIELYSRNNAGYVVTTRFDTDADNAIDRIENDYNANGVIERFSYDDDDDGYIDRVEFDEDEDGNIDSIETHERNDAGHIIRTDFDYGADGTADNIWLYTRDSQGRLLATASDLDANGVAEQTEYYDANRDIRRIDFNTDDAGPVERIERYTRNAAGDVFRVDLDYGADGFTDRARVDSNEDGALDRLEIYALNADNQRVETTVLGLSLRYQAVSDSPLALVDAGASSAPAFADLDGDGDLDLAVGAAAGDIRYYRNTGDSGAPAFAAVDDADSPFRGIDVGDAAMPAFADLDGDGDLDLAVGERDGVINYYKNTGSAATPVFEEQAGAASPLGGIRADSHALPAFADLDGDGDLDLAVGEHGSGRMRYYENTGGATAVFEHRTGKDNPFRLINAHGWDAPAFADLDGDGDLDLVVGVPTGKLRYFENEGSATAPKFVSRGWHRTPPAGTDQNFSPAFVDLDGDNLLEIFWGAADGRVQHYRLPVIVRETYTLNAAGDVIQTDIDEGGNGVIDRAEFDDAGDGTLDRSETYAYGTADGALGRLIKKQFDDAVDGALDGVFERSERYAYNESGAVIRTDFDEGDDGVIESAEFDDAGDGTMDRSETYTYGTTGGARGQRLKKQVDEYADDAFDGVFERSESYIYNDAGTLVRTDFDEGDDGVIERTVFADGSAERLEVYTWNVAGGLIKKEVDDGNDNAAGVYDRSETYIRAGAGPVTETEFDADADGTVDRREIDGDGDGRPERTESDTNDDGAVDRIEFDEDDDGAMDRAETYRRNGAGDVIETDYDTDADGVADRREFDANSDGAPERVEYDTDDDGTVNRREFDGDADGTKERVEFDTDDDGTVDRIEFDGDDDGRVDQRDFDADDDGAVDRAEYYVRSPATGGVIVTVFDDDNNGTADRTGYDADSDGNAERVEYDDDENGTVDRTRYDANSDGNAERVEYDDDENGTADRSETYVRNGAGDITRTDFDDDNDGTADRTETYAHSAAGDVIRTDFDDDNDGTADRTETYVRNAAGDVVRTDFDDAGNGVTDRSETYVRNALGAVVRVEVEHDKDRFIDEYRYDNDGDGAFDWMSYDLNNDGMMDRFEFHWEQDAGGNPLPMMYALMLDEDEHRHTVSFYDETGESASGQGATGARPIMERFSFVPDRDIVSELQPAAQTASVGLGTVLPVDAVLLAGVPAIQLAGGGAGSTDLSISGAALNALAGGDENYQLRINGDGDDTLRFDVDEFTEEERVDMDGEEYRQFVGEDGSFLVDPDIVLVDM